MNRYSVRQASFESVWAVQNSSAMLSGGGSEPLEGGVEDLTWIRQGSVLHDDTRGAWSGEDPLERLAVAVQILDIRTDRLHLKAAAAQFRGEPVERSPMSG